MRLFHLVDRTVWQSACDAGEYRPPSLAEEGFVHCSFADQVTTTANRYYRDEPDLVVVELEAEDLVDPVDPAADPAADPDDAPDIVRVEDSTGRGEAFPHVYGPVRTAAQVAVHELVRDDAGDWLFVPPPQEPAPTA